jgi:hypothetical protein
LGGFAILSNKLSFHLPPFIGIGLVSQKDNISSKSFNLANKKDKIGISYLVSYFTY